jgi:carboxypeptidase Q
MLKNKYIVLILIYAFLFSTPTFGQETAPSVYQAPKDVIQKIKDEGLNRSQVMETISYLTDVIGGRLTGSPNMKRANEWTRDQMSRWGMKNAHLEAWGTFGRGWSLKGFSAQVSEPYFFPVIAYPKAWSPTTKGFVTNKVVLLNAKTDEEFAKYKGQQKDKIVLISDSRTLKAIDTPLVSRFSDEELLKMANAPDPATVKNSQTNSETQTKNFINFFTVQAKRFSLAVEEVAAVIIDNSLRGSGGTIFVSGAGVPREIPEDAKTIAEFSQKFFGQSLKPYEREAEAKIVPQMTMASEDYNRLVRIIEQGITPKMSVNIDARFHDDDLKGYNTIGEIPGTDPKLKVEIVMLGGHLDSWHASTGATDNAAGCAVAMEAARILLATGLKPRRTIRVVLWSGEEQGIYGSRGYVEKHFGEMKDGNLIKKDEYEKLSAYYNLDNGTGKIRGIYTQGNSNVVPFFKTWLKPFTEMGATTITLSNTGGTDHLSFDRIGLPGFQFIQDEVEYDTRTHHSNQDYYDRIQADDMKQASVILAAFVYQTAMMDGKIPQK